ncbi:MAG: glycosyltransferase family 4 protein [Acidilobaceae archaeon]
MKIALVTDSYKPRIGGIESVVSDIAKTLSNNHKVYIVTSAKARGSGYILEYDGGYRVLRVKSRMLNFNGVTLNPPSLLVLYKVLRNIDPDVIHGHGLYSTLSIAGAIIGWKRLGKPSILTAHSFIGKDTPRYLVEGLRLASRNVSLVTAVSKAVAIDVSRRLKIRRVYVTYNCLRVDDWVRRGDKFIELDGEPIILSALRLTYRKNPLALVRVADYLKQYVPKARLYIAGDGPLRKPLESRIKARGLNNTVFLGPVSRETLKKILWSTDIFVLPSKMEAFGISALEAMASGVPVVAMRSGGVSEVVVDNVTGLLALDEDDLARKTVELSLNLELAKSIGRRALERAYYFDCNRIAYYHLEAYRIAGELCSSKVSRI